MNQEKNKRKYTNLEIILLVGKQEEGWILDGETVEDAISRLLGGNDL